MTRLVHKKSKAYTPVWRASDALDAVDQWLSDCVLLRETGCFGNGRLDGLIIPTSWSAPVKSGFYGVEVKLDRGDFLKGLNSGQFERYAACVNGLYIVTPVQGVAKTSEIPKHFGHLVVAERTDGKWSWNKVCVCKRHPKRSEISFEPATFWAIWWDLFDQMHRQTAKHRDKHESWKKAIGQKIVDRMMKQMNRIERESTPPQGARQ